MHLNVSFCVPQKKVNHKIYNDIVYVNTILILGGTEIACIVSFSSPYFNSLVKTD